MELEFIGNKVVVSVDGQRAATVYCVDYAAGRYDVVFNDDVAEQNPLPIFEMLLIDAKNRVPVVDFNEANTWKITVPSPVLSLAGLEARTVDGRIELMDGDRVLFFARPVAEDDVYELEEGSISDLNFAPLAVEMTVGCFAEMFPDRHVRLSKNTLYLSFLGNVSDHPLDMFHVKATGHGVFYINSPAGRVGEMREFALADGHASKVGVEFASYNSNAFPEEFCRELYKRTTGYNLGRCVAVEQQRFEVRVHEFAQLDGYECVLSTLTSTQQPENAWIAIRQMLPSVIISVNKKEYIVMPAYVDPRDCRTACYGNVVYFGNTIGQGIVLPHGYLCMEATNALCELFAPVVTKGMSAIPLASVLDAFMEASDLRDDLYVSPFGQEPSRGTDRRGEVRRDRGLTRRGDLGRSRGR